MFTFISVSPFISKETGERSKLCTETKNTWARDDPAILVLIAACLCGECSSGSCLLAIDKPLHQYLLLRGLLSIHTAF